MDGGAHLNEFEYLLERLRRETRSHRRELLVSDIASRLPRESTDELRVAKAFRAAGRHSETMDAAVLLGEQFLSQQRDVGSNEKADILLLCPKPIEWTAVKLVFGVDLSAQADRRPEGHHLFDRYVFSEALGRDLHVVLATLGGQTNMRTASTVTRLLALQPAHVAALVGMAAGVPDKVEPGDVVFAEHVLYIATGSRRDDGTVLEPEPYPLDPRIAVEVAHMTPQYHGWHQAYREVVNLASELGLVLPANGALNREPNLKIGVVLSDEMKDETTDLDSRAESIHGDACALEMEGAAFAMSCALNGVPWVIFRGIADLGLAGLRRIASKTDDASSGAKRPKEWQLAATIAATTACVTWMTTQLYVWERLEQ